MSVRFNTMMSASAMKKIARWRTYSSIQQQAFSATPQRTADNGHVCAVQLSRLVHHIGVEHAAWQAVNIGQCVYRIGHRGGIRIKFSHQFGYALASGNRTARPPTLFQHLEKAATGSAKVRACASSDFRSGQSYCTFVFWRIADSIADLLDMVAFLLLSLCFFVIKVVKCALSKMGHFTLSAPSIECILYHKVWHMIS